MTISTLLLLIAGFVLLVGGAEFLVRGASKIAAAIGVSPLIIGLTVVSFGTSSPEIAVSVQSSFIGKADIAIGNVVGSNIANILLVLGSSALAAPLLVSRQLIKLDVPIMIGVSVLLLAVGWDNNLSWLDGSVFLAVLVIYSVFLIKQSKRSPAEALDDEFVKEYGDVTALTPVQKWLINPAN
jgi:cation:H+ antiporter